MTDYKSANYPMSEDNEEDNWQHVSEPMEKVLEHLLRKSGAEKAEQDQ